MRKTDKKLDKQIRDILTTVCDQAIENITGFSWLTHQVNYQRFPDSLIITCIFTEREHLQQARQHQDDIYLSKLIEQSLKAHNIQLRTPKKQIRFDNEEDCELEHGGNWRLRLDS